MFVPTRRRHSTLAWARPDTHGPTYTAVRTTRKPWTPKKGSWTSSEEVEAAYRSTPRPAHLGRLLAGWDDDLSDGHSPSREIRRTLRAKLDGEESQPHHSTSAGETRSARSSSPTATRDMIAPIEAGRASIDFLRQWGYSPEYHEYEGMAHEIWPEVIDDFVEWLERLTQGKREQS